MSVLGRVPCFGRDKCRANEPDCFIIGHARVYVRIVAAKSRRQCGNFHIGAVGKTSSKLNVCRVRRHRRQSRSAQARVRRDVELDKRKARVHGRRAHFAHSGDRRGGWKSGRKNRSGIGLSLVWSKIAPANPKGLYLVRRSRSVRPAVLILQNPFLNNRVSAFRPELNRVDERDSIHVPYNRIEFDARQFDRLIETRES